jgi:hypothetical protein
MDTRQKGELAKLHAVMRAIEHGFVVSEPTTSARYDLVIDDGKRLWRAQVKWGGTPSQRSAGAFRVELRSENGNGGKGYLKLMYTEQEVDCLLVFIPGTGVVWLPHERFIGKTGLIIRVSPTKNGQASGLLLASDYLW